MLVMSVPMLIYKQWQILIGIAIGILSGLLPSLIIASPKIWSQYSSAMKVHGAIKLGVIKSNLRTDLIYPKTIEGMTNFLDAMNVPKVTTSIMYLANRFLGIKLYPSVLILLLAIVLLFICFFILKYRSSKVSMELVFLLGSFMVLISDFFLPAYRNSYIDVQWIVPIFLIVLLAEEKDLFSQKSTIILSLSLMLSSGFLWVSWGLLISAFLMILYTSLMTFLILKTNNSKSIREIQNKQMF